MRPCLMFFSAAVLSVTMSSAVSAQSFGAKGGLDLSRVTFASGTSASAGTAGAGFVVGGFAGLRLFWGLRLQGEVLLTQSRTSFEDVVTDRFRYLQVPVLLRYRVWGKAPGFVVHALGGPVYSSLVSATETVGGVDTDLSRAVASTEFGVAVGADVEIRPHWRADVRYQQGIDKIYNTIRGGAIGQRKSLQITAVYRLR
jgi:Outer membrane protein beta-barrel domain